MIQKSDFACRYIGTNLNVYVSVRSQSSRLATVEHSRTHVLEFTHSKMA